MPEVKDRQFLLAVHKKAKKKGFNIDEYNRLKKEVVEIEYDLRRLRDPLFVRSSPKTSYSTYLSAPPTTAAQHSDQLFQRAMTQPSIAAEAKKLTFTERISNVFQSARSKFRK